MPNVKPFNLAPVVQGSTSIHFVQFEDDTLNLHLITGQGDERETLTITLDPLRVIQLRNNLSKWTDAVRTRNRKRAQAQAKVG